MLWAAAAIVVTGAAFLLFFPAPIRRVAALNRAAQRACKRNDFTAAVQFCRDGHAAAGILNEPLKSRIEAKIEIHLATLLYRQGRMREADDLFKRGFSHARRSGCYPEMKPAYRAWGDLCADEERHEEAEQRYRIALQGEEQIGNRAGMVFALQRIGNSLICQGRRSDAEEIIESALALETEVVNEQMRKRGKNPNEHHVSSWSLPDLLFCREQYEEARRLYKEKVAFWEKSGARPDQIDLGHLQMRLAVSATRTGHLAEALDLYTRAEKTFEREWGEGHPKAASARDAKAALTRHMAESARS